MFIQFVVVLLVLFSQIQIHSVSAFCSSVALKSYSGCSLQTRNGNNVKMISNPISAAVIGLSIATLASPITFAPKQVEQGGKIFESSCIGCHVGGGNVIGYARGKTLKKGALEKNDLDEPQKIVSLLEEGKGVMPRYGKYIDKEGKTVQAKLSRDEMEAVAEYIIFQADKGWK